MKIVMLGAPGAGKGTNAERICSKYKIPHISTGDIFRENIKNGTELGKKAKSYMDQGNLVPDELTCDLVMDRINQDDCKNGFVLDGFPRTMPQAEALTKALEAKGEKMDYAINVVISDEEIVKRMSGRRSCPNCGAVYHLAKLIQRPDDSAETVANRLKVYHEQTEPLIAYYTAQGIIHEISGNTIEGHEYDEIVKILGE